MPFVSWSWSGWGPWTRLSTRRKRRPGQPNVLQTHWFLSRRASVLLRQAEAAREVVLQGLSASRETGIRHEVLMGIEGLLARGRAHALGGAVTEDAPALLVVLQIRNHDLIQDLLVHGR